MPRCATVLLPSSHAIIAPIINRFAHVSILIRFLTSPKAAATTREVIAIDGGRGSAVFF